MIHSPHTHEPLVIRKHRLLHPYTKDSLLHNSQPLTQLLVESKRPIEDCPNYSFVDFANCCVGGASLLSAAVQEEILFAIFPEACISMGVCEEMTDDEAISIDGVLRSANYTGYGHSFKYKEEVDLSYLFVSVINRTNRATDQIIAIDALCVEYSSQFQEDLMLREINKAVAGFQLSLDRKEGIASGKWGCGVFGGDPYLKSILQWIAASLVGKPVS